MRLWERTGESRGVTMETLPKLGTSVVLERIRHRLLRASYQGWQLSCTCRLQS